MKRSAFRLAPPRVAIVGSGPSGFYTAQAVLRGHPEAQVDLYEKLPVPFGLARYGVAPDHPEVKNVGMTFTELMAKHADRVRFHGNVSVGDAGDVAVKELLAHYHQVVIATGADQDRTIGIPGESEYTHPARKFVSWYNGLPGAEYPFSKPLSEIRRVAIIGNGNVALDCARVLLAPLSHLETTDITSEALAALENSKVVDVNVIARRGILNSAFTIKEFREMLNLMEKREAGEKGVTSNTYLATKVRNAEISEEEVAGLDRRYKRLTQLVLSARDAEEVSTQKSWGLTYLRRPVEATAEGLIVEEMTALPNGAVKGTGVTHLIEADLILSSVGYRSVFDDEGVPFDAKKGVVQAGPSGKVCAPGGDAVPNLYCTGWVKNGPVGVIASALIDSKQVAATLLREAEAEGDDAHASCSGLGHEGLPKQVAEKAVSWGVWEKICAHEAEQGSARGKEAEKVTSVAKMLEFA